MATEIKLPALGENVDSGTVVKVLVSVGDTVTADQSVLDLDTDKASVEVPASSAGTVKEIRVKEGETVKVGQVLLTLEEAAQKKEEKEEKPKPEAGEEAKKPETEQSQEKSAEEQEGQKHEAVPPAKLQPAADQKRQEKKPPSGEPGEAQERAEPERDSAKHQETPATSNNEAKETKPKPEAEEAPKKPEAEQSQEKSAEEQEGKKPESVPPKPKPAAEDKRGQKQPPKRPPGEAQARQRAAVSEVVPFRKEESPPSREPVPAAPSVRRVARELGIDINEVTGTGPDGRISEVDVRNHARSIILNSTVRKADLQAGGAELPDFSHWGEIERKPMSGVRRKTAEHLSEAWASIPHVTHFDTADVTELERLREEFAKKVEEAGGKLTITAIVLKIVSAALKMFPQFNTTLDVARDEIIYKKYFNIGIAVDTDRGLLVPVIRDTDKKNILELSLELTQVAQKARDKKLSAEEMQGATFTITNTGGIGGTGFTPIINSPEVAILGISRTTQQPVFRDGQFQPRLILPLALSFDHRVIDGADAARFLRWTAEALEQPFKLTLEG